MRLEGSLDAFSLPDIFALLSMTKKTGALHLRRGSAHGVVWLTTGSLTGGAADVGRQSLARRVAGAGLVGADALQQAVDRASGDADLGIVRALMQSGTVDEGALHDVVAEHVVDTVFDLLRWPDGDFAFVVDEPNPDDVGVSRQVDDVVAEARRRLEEWKSVAAAIPSPQAVLSVATTLEEDPRLSRDDWALLALVDGRRTVAQIVALTGRGDFAVVSALADLVARGLVRLGEHDATSELLRAHEILAAVEAGADDAVPAEQAEPVVVEAELTVAEPTVAEPTVAEPPAAEPRAAEPQVGASPAAEQTDDGAAGEAASSALDEELPAEPVAPVTRLTAVPSQHTGAAEITPKRPEPFLPTRKPDHPEEPMPAVAAVAGGAASPVPAAASYIERDPSVNKSLLLRLIAGVRGL